LTGVAPDWSVTMRRVVLSVLLLAAPAVGAAPAPFARPERSDWRTDLERMQGEWEPVAPKEVGRAWVAIVTGDRIRWYAGTFNECEEVIRASATGGPKAIDFMSRTGLRCRGIYRLDADTLTICVGPPGGDRPTSVVGGRADDVVIRLRRKR
jgi:uncharacterized protein (TIGR03067 family)